MPINRGSAATTMVAKINLKPETLQSIADEVSRSLSSVSMYGDTAFISTAVSYPNGTSVVIRIDVNGEDFFVSDDGQGALCAELFGGLPQFGKIAQQTAKRFFVDYDQRSFFLLKASREQLPVAVSHIANASAQAVNQTLFVLDKKKAKASQELFINRITEAFGREAAFNVPVLGRTKEWEIDAAVIHDSRVAAVFQYVTPVHISIATAYMKMSDISASIERPKTAIVLSSYEGTEAPIRQILSTSADAIIAANSNAEKYRLSVA